MSSEDDEQAAMDDEFVRRFLSDENVRRQADKMLNDYRMSAAVANEALERDCAEVLERTPQRYETDVWFYHRVNGVATAFERANQEKLIDIPKGMAARLIRSEVASFLALDDFLCEKMQESGQTVPRGPSRPWKRPDPLVRPPGN